MQQSLMAVIGIEYDRQALKQNGVPSGDTYKGVSVFVEMRDRTKSKTTVFNTGDPVADLKPAREFARNSSPNVFSSMTWDAFVEGSDGRYVEAYDADGYRVIASTVAA